MVYLGLPILGGGWGLRGWSPQRNGFQVSQQFCSGGGLQQVSILSSNGADRRSQVEYPCAWLPPLTWLWFPRTVQRLLTRGNSPGRNCKVTTISPLIFPAALTAVAASWGENVAGSLEICLHARSEFSNVACVMHPRAHVFVLGARNLSVCQVSATGDNPTQGRRSLAVS